MLLRGNRREQIDFPRLWRGFKANSFMEVKTGSISGRGSKTGLPTLGNIIGLFLERGMGSRDTGL